MIINIHTDGAIQQSTKVGGWAAVIVENSEPAEIIAGRELDTTSNRMELRAVLEALEYVTLRHLDNLSDVEATITSDSQYVVNGATVWLQGWIRNNWRGSSGKISNRDLWAIMSDYKHIMKITFKWVKGHATDQMNILCDKLAVSQYKEIDPLTEE